MARLLAIGPEEQAAIAKVVRFAEANVLSMDDVKATMAGNRPPAGDYPEHVVKLPVGFTCVYSIEVQPMGKCRHLSVSVDAEGRCPSPDAMNMIAPEFGFRPGKLDGFSIEKESQAINMFQRMEA